MAEVLNNTSTIKKAKEISRHAWQERNIILTLQSRHCYSKTLFCLNKHPLFFFFIEHSILVLQIFFAFLSDNSIFQIDTPKLPIQSHSPPNHSLLKPNTFFSLINTSRSLSIVTASSLWMTATQKKPNRISWSFLGERKITAMGKQCNASPDVTWTIILLHRL